MVLGVLEFPDIDCGKITFDVLSRILKLETKAIWHNSSSINGIDALFISGGTQWLSFLKELNETSPIIEAILEYAEKGKFIFGTGNGFNLLCDLKLLPGTFATNKDSKLLSRSVYLKVGNSNTALTSLVDKTGRLKLPLSVQNGCYKASENELMQMHQNKQIVFRYCDESAKVSEKVNYTGSVDNIASICNQQGTIFGILPSPERAVEERLGNTDGRYIFESILAWIK
jgi:phosphoribosylformylglycinamidine synthase subunit PurQ / glutaminase